MQNRGPGATPVRSSDFIIRIEAYDGRIMSGAIEHSSTGDYVVFYGLSSLIEAIQAKMDECTFPQATMALRSWNLPSPSDSEESAEEQEELADSVWGEDTAYHKALASFILRVQFRQNACWQGSLAWMETKKSLAFRSVLELVSLLSTALDASIRERPSAVVWKPPASWRLKATVS